ncbi:hypothetical protein Btru_060296 [Bulinus truncatus]|nr:hypothetical protein Btru_060296 [Bulinus truncatus]
MSSLYSSTSGSSLSSDLSGNLLPRCRIQCLTSQIKVGGQNFQSATDALSSYLQQFGDLNGGLKKSDNFLSSPLLNAYLSKRKLSNSSKRCVSESGYIYSVAKSREDVENLLISKPDKTSQDEISDTEVQKRLAQLLKQSSQEQTKTGLQEEVEAALLRTAKLLEKVSEDNLRSPQKVSSDISDVPTDILISNSFIQQQNNLENQTKHIYSYHTKRSQNHKSSGKSHAPISYTNCRQSRDRKKSSLNGKLFTSVQKNSSDLKRAHSLSRSLSKQHNPIVHEEFLRSRSASPGLRTSQFVTDTEVTEKYKSPQYSNSVPSWVREENFSEISDSIWQSKSHKALNSCDVQNSTTMGVDPHLSTYSHSHLNISASTAYTPSLDSRGSHHDHRSLTKEPVQHSTPLSYMTKNSMTKHLQNSKHMLSDFHTDEFLDSITLPQATDLKKSLEDLAISSENYLHLRSVSSSSSSDSSLDTLTLLAGRTKPHVTVNSSHLDVPTVNFTLDYESEGLDGDRSWEKVNNFKPAVPVDGHGMDINTKLPNGCIVLEVEDNHEPIAVSLTETNRVNLPALLDYDFNQEPGGHSLEQALVHLNRLKELVKNTQVATGSALKI